MKLLKKFPTLFKPTANEGVQVWECSVFGDGDVGVIITHHGKQGGKMTENSDVIKAGKNVGRKNETTPQQQALLEAESEWTMKIGRKGYAEKLEDSNRFDSPMLAQKFKDLRDKIDYNGSFGQRKLNGYRCLAEKLRGGQVTLTSREHGPFDLPHIASELAVVMQAGDVFDGEVFLHGFSLQRISSLIKRPRAESETLELNLYDAGLEDVPYGGRAAFLKERLGGERRGPLVQLESVPMANEKQLMAFQADCIAEGYEGAMLRWGKKGYEYGKRSQSLVKVKTFLDKEFEVIGCKEGRGSHAGMAIFRCQTDAGHPFDVTAPGTHPEKRHYWLAHSFYLGCQLTVKYQEMTQTEKPVPFHPHAVGFRENPKLKAAIKAMQAQGFTHPEK